VPITVKRTGQEAGQPSKTKSIFVKVKPVKLNIGLDVMKETKWLPWENLEPEYEERSELLAVFTSIGKNE